ncbi:MAG: type II toxin-antitoxin system prevent-host-death family antitoxin, partial [Proteobacteria bacterium]|nr:type II toxin-antitoxin system prevent-host-death family antitoxin [Pseudomonadota bacterium]
MPVVDICEAKARLIILVEQAASGHDVVIARGGKPVARLTLIRRYPRKYRHSLKAADAPASESNRRRHCCAGAALTQPQSVQPAGCS